MEKNTGKLPKQGDKEAWPKWKNRSKLHKNEMEMSNLSDAEFKTLVISTLEEFIEDLKSIKKTQLEMKDTLIE